MAYIIGIILLIITLIITGLILRKRVYDSVDKQEEWKMEIMNRNIASELARIKRLNLSGETQIKFESWKEQWEFIVAKEMPDIEEYLFDAEDAADRYRFPSAKKALQKIEQSLESIEANIEGILKELDELLKSEETSRIEIEQLQPDINELRKILSQNRYQYGAAEVYFDTEIDTYEEKIREYELLVRDGNYLEAKQLASKLTTDKENLQEKILEFPEIYVMCNKELPSQLQDLSIGLKDMKDNGYRIDHLKLDKEIVDYEQRLLDCIRSLEKGGTAEVKVVIHEIEERIREMYDLLEKEALDKNYIEIQFPSYKDTLEEVGTTFTETSEEVKRLRKTYYFEDSDMEQYLLLDKEITQLKNQLGELSTELDNKNTAHSEIRAQIESGFKQLEELQQSHKDFKARINNLRKDELVAKNKLTQMNEQILHINRKLRKSNIPGVPDFIWDTIRTASDQNDRVIKALDKQPLDIAEVQRALNEAESSVDHALNQTDFIIEQAYLTEQVIQYANRYRSRYPILAANLMESERLFRSYEYELALEHAAKAVEEVEPGALKRIEVHQEVLN